MRRQVAGYQTRFQDAKLSFVTVHYAGHEVPAYQPARALRLLAKYLDGSWWEEGVGDGDGGAVTDGQEAGVMSA